MLVEALTLVRDRLLDPATGVNALLATIPGDVGAPACPACTLVTQLERPTLALGPVHADLFEEFPAPNTLLLLAIAHDVVFPVSPAVRAAEGAKPGEALLVVQLRIVPAPTTDPRTVGLIAMRTWRAAARAIVAPSTTAGQSAQRVAVHGATIGAPLTAQYAPPDPALAGEWFVPALLLPFPASDAWLKGSLA